MQKPSDVVTAWGAIASRIAADATSLAKLVALLPAPAGYEFGRFDGGAALSSFSNARQPVIDSSATIATLEAKAAGLRAGVTLAVAKAETAAASLAASTASAFSAAIQAVAASVLACFIDPADAMRLLPLLADFTPNPLPSNAPLGQRQAAVIMAIGDLCRRSAVSALAQASSNYQPASQDDAQSISELVCGMIQAEMLIAGDDGQDGTFNGLRALLSAVSADLSTRGASLATVESVSLPSPLPALVVANRLYRDSTREAEIVSEASPVHPAFTPTAFKALAS
jgi:prophage DNA circulation protein